MHATAFNDNLVTIAYFSRPGRNRKFFQSRGLQAQSVHDIACRLLIELNSTTECQFVIELPKDAPILIKSISKKNLGNKFSLAANTPFYFTIEVKDKRFAEYTNIKIQQITPSVKKLLDRDLITRQPRWLSRNKTVTPYTKLVDGRRLRHNDVFFGTGKNTRKSRKHVPFINNNNNVGNPADGLDDTIIDLSSHIVQNIYNTHTNNYYLNSNGVDSNRNNNNDDNNTENRPVNSQSQQAEMWNIFQKVVEMCRLEDAATESESEVQNSNSPSHPNE